MLEKIKNQKGKILAGLTAGAGVLVPSCCAFAADGDSAGTVDWSSAGSQITSSFSSALGTLLPVGVTIFVGLLVIGFGPKIVKKLAK